MPVSLRRTIGAVPRIFRIMVSWEGRVWRARRVTSRSLGLATVQVASSSKTSTGRVCSLQATRSRSASRSRNWLAAWAGYLAASSSPMARIFVCTDTFSTLWSGGPAPRPDLLYHRRATMHRRHRCHRDHRRHRPGIAASRIPSTRSRHPRAHRHDAALRWRGSGIRAQRSAGWRHCSGAGRRRRGRLRISWLSQHRGRSGSPVPPALWRQPPDEERE